MFEYVLTDIEEIHLSSENSNKQVLDVNEITDVVVRLRNGKQFISSFFTFKKIIELEKDHKKLRKYLNGKYYWSKDMILISKCDRDTITEVVNDLMEEGSFYEAFRDISKSDFEYD